MGCLDWIGTLSVSGSTDSRTSFEPFSVGALNGSIKSDERRSVRGVMTIHAALLRANAVGLTATLRHAAEAGRVVVSYEDRCAGYRASGEVLAREGFGYTHEGPHNENARDLPL